MKKFIFGLVLGAGLMMAFQVGAETISLIGTKVGGEMKVTLDGKDLGTAPIINGSSYLPVRKMSEETGIEVKSFDGGVIVLETQTKTNEDEINAELNAITDEFNRIATNRWNAKKAMENAKTAVDGLKTKWIPEAQELLDNADDSNEKFYQGMLENHKKQLAEQEAEYVAQKKIFDEYDALLKEFLVKHPEFKDGVNW